MILSKISMLKFLVVVYPHDILLMTLYFLSFSRTFAFSAGDNSFFFFLFIRYSKNELLSKVNRIQGRGVFPRSYAKERGKETCNSIHAF